MTEIVDTKKERSPIVKADLKDFTDDGLIEEVGGPIFAQVFDEHKQPEDVEGFLGSGRDKHAFKVGHNGGEVVVKLIKRGFYASGDELAALVEDATLSSAAPLIQGRGVDGLEQLIAADTDRGILVTTLAPGKILSDMRSLELMKIRESHLKKLDVTLKAMRELHLHPHNVGGIFFDKKHGFTFADYEFDDNILNRGSIADLEEFLFYGLTDFKNLDFWTRVAQSGQKVSDDKFQTTGVRAMARSSIMRRAQKLQ